MYERVVAELRRLPENIRRYELPGNLRYQLTPRVRAAEATALTTLLIEMHRLFTSSQKHTGGSDSQHFELSPAPKITPQGEWP